MRKAAIAIALLLSAAGVAAATDFQSVGIGEGVILPSGDENPCPGSTLHCNHDGSFENGYAWTYGGIVPPYYGAFAEGFEATGTVCGIQFHFTTVAGVFNNQSMDAYVWDSDGTNPNNVLTVTTDLHISMPAIWPSISTHDIDINDAAVDGGFFVGYWGNWPQAPQGWYMAVDLDGPGGVPRTNIAPGIGYPTGWQDPSIVWGPTMSLGICAYVEEGGTPVEETTWGAIKALY